MGQLPEYSKHFSLTQSVHIYRTDTNLIPNRLKNNLNVQHGKFFFWCPRASAELFRTVNSSYNKNNQGKTE